MDMYGLNNNDVMNTCEHTTWLEKWSIANTWKPWLYPLLSLPEFAVATCISWLLSENSTYCLKIQWALIILLLCFTPT